LEGAWNMVKRLGCVFLPPPAVLIIIAGIVIVLLLTGVI